LAILQWEGCRFGNTSTSFRLVTSMSFRVRNGRPSARIVRDGLPILASISAALAGPHLFARLPRGISGIKGSRILLFKAAHLQLPGTSVTQTTLNNDLQCFKEHHLDYLVANRPPLRLPAQTANMKRIPEKAVEANAVHPPILTMRVMRPQNQVALSSMPKSWRNVKY
jgi:hypothetical protein